MPDKIMLAVPVLPGKAEQTKAIAQATMGPRKAEYLASHTAQLGITKDSWYLQIFPDGSGLLMTYLESPDSVRTLADFSASQHPFELWLKQQVKEISGVDFSQPMPGRPSQLLLDWAVLEDNAHYAALALPVSSDKLPQIQAFAAQLIEQRTQHQASMARVELTKESFHYQPAPDGNGLWLIYWEETNPWKAMAQLSQSQEPFDVWLMQQFQAITGIDMSQPAPISPPQIIFSSPRGL
jgi:hypothetical protein